VSSGHSVITYSISANMIQANCSMCTHYCFWYPLGSLYVNGFYLDVFCEKFVDVEMKYMPRVKGNVISNSQNILPSYDQSNDVILFRQHTWKLNCNGLAAKIVIWSMCRVGVLQWMVMSTSGASILSRLWFPHGRVEPGDITRIPGHNGRLSSFWNFTCV